MRRRPQPRPKGLRVVFMGDSITDGNWGKADGKPSSERNLWDRNHLYGSGYMYLCATYYQSSFPDRDYRFFNRGVGGHALSDLAARWQEDVLDLRPDVLSVFIGTNDVERHLRKLLRADDPQAVPDFDFAAWEKTYRSLLDKAREANPALKIVLCTPFAAPCGKIVEGALGAYYPLRQRMLARCCEAVERDRRRLRRDARSVPPAHRRTGVPAAERRCYLLGVGRHPPHACRPAPDGRLLDRDRGPQRRDGIEKGLSNKSDF